MYVNYSWNNLTTTNYEKTQTHINMMCLLSCIFPQSPWSRCNGSDTLTSLARVNNSYVSCACCTCKSPSMVENNRAGPIGVIQIQKLPTKSNIYSMYDCGIHPLKSHHYFRVSSLCWNSCVAYRWRLTCYGVICAYWKRSSATQTMLFLGKLKMPWSCREWQTCWFTWCIWKLLSIAFHFCVAWTAFSAFRTVCICPILVHSFTYQQFTFSSFLMTVYYVNCSICLFACSIPFNCFDIFFSLFMTHEDWWTNTKLKW